MAGSVRSFHPLARQEARHEARHYERAAGLGARFLEALEAAVDRACEAPESGRPVGKKGACVVRSVPVKGYPFTVVYYDTGVIVRFLAVAHRKRNPGYWRRRS